MWILFACASSFFAGITAVLAKCGIRELHSTTVCALRTVVVLIFAWLLVWVCGSAGEISHITAKSGLFLIFSGLATGASWLCYLHALQIGEVARVVSIDKSSTALTLILATIFLHESLSPSKVLALICIFIGSLLLVNKKQATTQNEENCSDDQRDLKDAGSDVHKGLHIRKDWLLYACLSAFFASLTAILGKVGIQDIDSNLGCALRTSVVVVMAWLVVFITHNQHELTQVKRRDFIFIVLSGLATGASWLCYYRALQDGLTSAVVAIDRLSIMVTFIFSWIVFHEKPQCTTWAALVCILGAALLLVFA